LGVTNGTILDPKCDILFTPEVGLGRDEAMRRREFIKLIGGAAAAWPLTARGQVTRKRPSIGGLSFGSRDDPLIARYIDRFLSGMRELGYAEGRDFDVTYGMADFDAERLRQVAADMVKLAPDVIEAGATIEAVAAAKATSTIPIVVGVLADPVALGFAASNARPSGNVTGIMPYVKGLPAKQLELAREVVPGATRIGLIDDLIDPKAHPQRQEIEATARTLEIEIVPAEVRTAADLDAAYQALTSTGVQAVVVEQSGMLLLARKPIAQAAASKRLPTVYGYREHVEAGGLLSYGVNLDWCNHRAAYYVDKILKGAKPSDLPIEFPTDIELVINLKTAKALGLNISPMLLTRADEVIE
jgi:putative tryptophan/tyrosine transport system substrate-binding protein